MTRQEVLDYFGNTCNKCGSTDNLEVDHIDPSTKKFPIGGNLSRNPETLYKELLKCQLLCHTCHWVKTRSQLPKKVLQHGINYTYNYYKCRCELCTKAHRESTQRYIYTGSYKLLQT